MKHALKTNTAKCAAAALALVLLGGCSAAGGADGPTPSAPLEETPAETTVPPAVTETPGPVVYESTEYGFTFTLPDSWEGYTIVEDRWTAVYLHGGKDPITGTKLLIRHPDWTEETPREDIPIMVIPLDLLVSSQD